MISGAALLSSLNSIFHWLPFAAAYRAKSEREITFLLFDSNHEGFINALEVLAAKCFFCRGPTAAEKCHFMFELFDKDKSDLLDKGK